MPEDVKAGDTRAQGNRLLGQWRFSVPTAVAKTVVCGLVALAVVWGPDLLGWNPYDGLSVIGPLVVIVWCRILAAILG
jgi:hypothetical protein